MQYQLKCYLEHDLKEGWKILEEVVWVECQLKVPIYLGQGELQTKYLQKGITFCKKQISIGV